MRVNVVFSLSLTMLAASAHAQGGDYSSRVDCAPDGDLDSCVGSRGCLLDEDTSEEGAPWCYFPDNYGYALSGEVEETDSGLAASLARNPELGDATFVGGDFDALALEVEFQTSERLRIRITSVEDGKSVQILMLGCYCCICWWCCCWCWCCCCCSYCCCGSYCRF